MSATKRRAHDQSFPMRNQRKRPYNSVCEIYDQPVIGYYGLYNQGATCYLNAVLQTLFMTKQFREAVESSEPSTTFENHLKKLFQKLKKDNAVVENELLTDLGIRNKYEQHDAAEYFQKIVILCNFPRIYHGKLKNFTKCLKHGYECEQECSSFVILPLAIESHQNFSVMDGWNEFFKPSVLDGDNQLYCDFCDEKTDTEAVCELVSYPEVLTLQLKRFYFDYNHMMYMKNNCKVEIPLQLRVTQKYTYELYAIIRHSGSVKSGHYTTTIKSFEDGNWYHFDDSHVLRVNPMINNQNTVTCEHAYLLLYTRRDSGSPEHCTDERSKVCEQSNRKNKREEPGENDVATLIKGGHFDVEDCADRAFQKVDGHKRGPKESIHEGDWSTYGHSTAGDAGRKWRCKSHGEERAGCVRPSTHLLPEMACPIQGRGGSGAHPRGYGRKAGSNPDWGANPSQRPEYVPITEAGNRDCVAGRRGGERSIMTNHSQRPEYVPITEAGNRDCVAGRRGGERSIMTNHSQRPEYVPITEAGNRDCVAGRRGGERSIMTNHSQRPEYVPITEAGNRDCVASRRGGKRSIMTNPSQRPEYVPITEAGNRDCVAGRKGGERSIMTNPSQRPEYVPITEAGNRDCVAGRRGGKRSIMTNPSQRPEYVPITEAGNRDCVASRRGGKRSIMTNPSQRPEYVPITEAGNRDCVAGRRGGERSIMTNPSQRPEYVPITEAGNRDCVAGRRGGERSIMTNPSQRPEYVPITEAGNRDCVAGRRGGKRSIMTNPSQRPEYVPITEAGNRDCVAGRRGGERSIMTEKAYKRDNTGCGKGAKKDSEKITRDKRDECSPKRNDDREEDRNRTHCFSFLKFRDFWQMLTSCQ